MADTPARATGLLTCAVVLTAGLASAATPAVPLLGDAAVPHAVQPAVLLALFLAFVGAELAVVHVELRRQAYSFSPSGIALVVGVLFCNPHEVVLARVAGAVVVLVWKRPQLLKFAYNLGAYTLEASLVGFGAHLVVGHTAELTIATAGACYAVSALVELVMSMLVLLVISWHQGRVTLHQVIGASVPAAALSAACTTVAVAAALLFSHGALGVLLLTALMAGSVAVFRTYRTLHRRHELLELIHEFVAQGVGAGDAEQLSEQLLVRIRRLMHAGSVELTLPREGTQVHLRVSEDDVLHTFRGPPATTIDWLFTRVVTNHEPIVISRNNRERGMRQWLLDHDIRDVLIVPLGARGTGDILLVKDRLGEAATFTTDDLTLLQTLARHITVALRGAQLVQQLRHEATHDGLTGLPNRTLLTERLQLALHDRIPTPERPTPGLAPTPPVPPTVLLLDLNKFKEVNDALGHHVGDALLQVVATRLRACVPASATVARLGGDEFAVLLPATSPTEEDSPAVARAITQALRTPISLTEAVVSTTASIGIAAASPGLSSADVLRHADTAMYSAKDAGLACAIYTGELDLGRAERLALLADLHLALERDELELRYQPQLDLRTGEISSVEALVRWRHPTQGLMNPDAFIPLAEASGLIEALTHRVLQLALAQSRAWRDAGIDMVVAVNLSAHNVNVPNLAEHVAAELVSAGVPANRLVLELTESAVMGDAERTVPILQRLADTGVTLSLDDFGTGYSSLSYLQRLPVSEVKIDRSFVAGMAAESDGASSVLVRSILSLGVSLGLRVVAEGVEDAAVLARLRGLGCDLAQGYFIGRPQTAGELASTVLSVKRAARTHLTVLPG